MPLVLLQAVALATAAQATVPRALSVEDAKHLFPLLRDGGPAAEHEYDPRVWFRRKPGLDLTVDHPEIPGGRWRLRTNSLGLRMDSELADPPAEITLLLTGDANLEGVCSNDAAIAARVADSLSELHPDTALEVINAGTAGYGFYQYAQVLERFAERKPKLFAVLACFNDFEECLAPYHYFSGTAGPTLEGEAAQAYATAAKRWPEDMAQGLAGVWLFERHPAALETALTVASALFGEMAGRCSALGAELVVLWCPPFFALDPEAAAAELAEPCGALGIGAQQLAAADAIASRFVDALRGMRIAVIDLRPVFARADEPLHWKSDRHLNTTANALVAREIAKRYELLHARQRTEER